MALKKNQFRTTRTVEKEETVIITVDIDELLSEVLEMMKDWTDSGLPLESFEGYIGANVFTEEVID